jgi:predicted HicB family RNase H-like nuclease
VAAKPSVALKNDTDTAGDGISNDGTMVVSGLEAGATWSYSADNGVTFKAGTGTSFVLPAATYAIGAVQVKQTDVAGNTSAAGSNAAAVQIKSGDITAKHTADAQTLTGTNGVKDVFVLDYVADANGAFGDFGQVTIANYNKADGDVVRMLNSNTKLTVDSISKFVAGGAIQANNGNAKINFADDPSVLGAAEQSVTMSGVVAPKAFGLVLSDLSSLVNFEFAVPAAGSTTTGGTTTGGTTTGGTTTGSTTTGGITTGGTTTGGTTTTLPEKTQTAVSTASAQTLTGTTGTKDIFVFDYKADANGAFGDFGQVTINGYNKAEGDTLKLQNTNTAISVKDVSAFVKGGAVQANGGSSKINFADDPSVNGAAEQYIVLTGVTQDKAFGAELANVQANFTFV